MTIFKMDIKNMLFMCLGVIGVFILGLIFGLSLHPQSPWIPQTDKTKISVTPEPTEAITESVTESPDYPNKEFYKSVLVSEYLINTDPTFENLTGDGEVAVLSSVGEGCGSCHARNIYIFDGQKELFSFLGDDTDFYPIYGLGFALVQPVRKDGEPYSNPSEYQSAIYLWNGKEFVKSKTTPNWKE